MASFYRNGKNYHISVWFNGKNARRTLGTDDIRVATSLQPIIEKELLLELMETKKSAQNLSFSELYIQYLKAHIE